MTAIINGIQYIGGQTAPDEFIKNQAGTIDGDQTVENAVLAGPSYCSWNNNSNRDFSNSHNVKNRSKYSCTTMRNYLNTR